MKFRGYKACFRLNLIHSINISGINQQPHPHTIEISIYISQKQKEFVSFEVIEQYVNSYLNRFSGQYINDFDDFSDIQPTIENIGIVFNRNIKARLLQNGFILDKFEIGETPSRIYVIDSRNEDNIESKSLRNQKLNLIIDKLEQTVSNRAKAKSIEAETQMSILRHNEGLNISSVITSIDKENKSEIFLNSKLGKNQLEQIERFKTIKVLFAILLILIAGLALMMYVKSSKNYPLGLDLYGHLYKSDFLYNSIKSGEFYPLYVPSWYNGIQPFRFWSPIPYYIMAFFQWISGGNVINAFVLFIGFSYIVGAVGWLLWGIKENKIVLCTFFALLWFFLPDNLRVFFSEGNLPRMTVTIFLPYIFYYIWNFVSRNENKKIFAIIALMAFTTLCHAMISAMVGVGTFIFLVVYSIKNKQYKNSIYCLCAMLAGIALVGIWLYPALTGGIMNTNSESISEILYTKASVSLNPLLRFQNNIGSYYYGLAIFVISIIGILASNKKSSPGFASLLIIFAGTTTTLAPLISKIPLSNLLWFRRFTPIAYALFIIALINWKECKRTVVAIICILLIVDCIPSFQLDAYQKTMPGGVTDATQEQVANYYLLSDAKQITNQRLTLMDLSTYGPFPSYYVCSVEPKTAYTFGWAWQASTTGPNIVSLNTALETCQFNYLFDRSIELGSDTVVVAKQHIKNSNENMPKLKGSAQRLGFALIKENEQSIVFHLDTPKQFGVVTEYKGLAIGNSAKEITLQFPYFEQGLSNNLEDYTYEELVKYEKLYLSDFIYTNKRNAEHIVNKLTENGVKVFIDMNRIPFDKITNRSEFLGVTAQPVQLKNKYPSIYYNSNIIESSNFVSEYADWNTVYLDGITNTQAFSWFADQKMSIIGTKNNPNTIFLGFNLLYHAMTANDKMISELMADVIQVGKNDLPKRNIVPIDVVSNTKEIIINSPVNNLNTSLAFQDNFVTKKEIKNKNNLLQVNQGQTIITFKYPYLLYGSIISIIGLAVSAILVTMLFYKNKKKQLILDKKKGRLT